MGSVGSGRINTKLMFPDAGRGSCINCGFLSRVDPRAPSALLEVSYPDRSNGHGTFRTLRCLKQAENIEDLITQEDARITRAGSAGSENARITATKMILREKRGCPSFHAWIQHFDPRWHYEDWRIMELEDLRQRQAEMMIEFAGTQVEISQALKATVDTQAKMATDADAESGRFNRRFSYLWLVAIVLALATLVFPSGVPSLSIDNGDGPHTVVVLTPTPPATTPIPQSTPRTAASPP